MKKIKVLVVLIVIVLLTSGCFKRDNMENITIYTSNYPIYYVTNFLYGDKATINSIYPTGVIVDKYELTQKQIEDYSKSDLLVYNGLSKEKSYAVKMLNLNNDIKIIDATLTMEYNKKIEELWLNPSNMLMIAQNLKKGLNQYITNHYIKNEIDASYQELKVILSELDVELKKLGENADDGIIVVNNDLLLYLEKYGLNVISLEENENLTDKTINEVETLIKDKTIKYIFILENEEANSTVSALIDKYEISTLSFNTLSNITDEEKNNKIDYKIKMIENIDLLKKELY